ncbi:MULTISPECIES: MFS transporter [unclassified Paraburkholderia]|uniref:MFS transporter n=1 Tax=unclassified Paraburkholderia TaxID=2615204 RepID=UPI002AB13A68|nr:MULTISPECIES: MFS transporter [unclassified Paraburkholderia]
MTTASTHAGKKRPSLTQIVVATSAGNALEWFDIAIYGFFAVFIGKHFFPAASETASLLLTFGAFGASYLVRPLGGMVLGAYADRRGRKAALMLSVSLMMVGTAIIALVPDYAAIGMAAPLAVLAARLIQGFSAGGEFGASTAMLIEHAPHRRGFIASWQFATQGLATLLAASFGYGLAKAMAPADLAAWGWRLPFFFGLLIGPVGLYLRRFIEDAEDFTQAARTESPVREVFAKQKRLVLTSIGLLTVSTAVNYLLQYVPTFAIRDLHLGAATGFAATMVGGVILTVVTPFAGHLSDRIGRRRQMTWVALLFAITAYPGFAWATSQGGAMPLFVLIAWLALLKSIYFGALPALMAEIFPAATRATGMAIGYNVGVTVFGGFTPAIVTWLLGATGDNSAPSYYLILTATISLAALAWVSRVSVEPLARRAAA